MEAMKRMFPNQSMAASFEERAARGLLRRPRLRERGRARAQSGRLIQKHQRQEEARRPPMRGPVREPRAQALRTMEKYFGRWRRGTMSA